MILTVEIDLQKLPDNLDKRTVALLDIFHQLTHEVVTVGGHLTSTIPVLSRQGGAGSVRVGHWQVHFDDGVDS